MKSHSLTSNPFSPLREQNLKRYADYLTGNENLVALKKNRKIEAIYEKYFSKIRKLSHSKKPKKQENCNFVT